MWLLVVGTRIIIIHGNAFVNNSIIQYIIAQHQCMLMGVTIHRNVLRFDQAWFRNLFIFFESRALLFPSLLLLVVFHSRATCSKYFVRSLSRKIR